MTKIGSKAFGWTGLTSLIVPESVTDIGSYNIVSGCSDLTALYILNTTPPRIRGEYCTTDEYMTLNVFVPQEALAAYQSAVGWKNFWNLQGYTPTGDTPTEDTPTEDTPTEDTPTGVESIKNDDTNVNNNYYDLRGNKLNAPKRGLNIINGRKVMVK